MAASLVVETPPKKFRVGPEKNKYNYTLVSTEHRSRNDWIWECEKSADDWAAQPGEVLFIVYVADVSKGTKGFMAMHAPKGTTKKEDILEANNMIFSSSEDVFLAGTHSWQWWDDKKLEFHIRAMEFDTTILQDSAP